MGTLAGEKCFFAGKASKKTDLTLFFRRAKKLCEAIGGFMTVRQAILQADELRPNAISEEHKARWLHQLDGRLA